MVRHEVISQQDIGYVVPTGARRYRCTLTQVSSLVRQPYLAFTLPAAPEGYRYKSCWPAKLVKCVVFKMGAETIHDELGEWLEVQYHCMPQADWMALLMFDVSDEERTRLSRLPVEGMLYLHVDHDIPMNQRVAPPCFTVELNDARTLLERVDGGRAPPVAPVPAPDVTLALRGCAVQLDDDSHRLAVAAAHRFNIIQNVCTTLDAVRVGGGLRTTLNVQYDGAACSAAYLHVTDEEGAELPFQAIRRIQVRLWGFMTQELSGLECRTSVRARLPHATRTPPSHNVYFMSFHAPGVAGEVAGAENGLRLTQHSMDIEWQAGMAGRSVKLLLVHRTQNQLRISHEVSLRDDSAFAFVAVGGVGVLNPVAPSLPAPAQPAPKAVARIAVPAGATTCSITMLPIADGDEVLQCQRCKNAFTAEAFMTWVRTVAQPACPLCRFPYGSDAFHRGPARVAEAPQEETREPARNPEREGLLQERREAVHAAAVWQLLLS